MKAADTRIGILGLLAATLLALAALLVFARYPGLFHTGREYRAVFRSVSGLNEGDDVRYGGLPVGVVTRMEIDPHDPTRIEVYFRVRSTTPVRSDTRATITQVGFLGEPYLHLTPGSQSAPALASGATVPSEESPSFQDTMRRLAQFLQGADSLMGTASRFAAVAPAERIDRTLRRIDTLLDVTTHGSRGTFARLDTTFVQVDRASARLTALLERSERLLASADTTINSSGAGLATTQREALRTVEELRALIGDLRDAMQEQGGMDQLVRNMSTASENMARLTDRLERDPSSLFKRRSAPAKPAGPSVRP